MAKSIQNGQDFQDDFKMKQKLEKIKKYQCLVVFIWG